MLRILAAALLLTIGASGQPALPPAKQQKIERLLKAMNAESVMGQIFEQIRSESISQLPPNATFEQAAQFKEFHEKLMEMVASRMNWNIMKPLYLKLYNETFTDEEMDGMIAFYESPVGKAMMTKMPLLTQKTLYATQQIINGLMPEMNRLAREMGEKDKAKQKQ